MKVSFLVLHLGYGGIQRSTTDLANILSKKHDVTIYCTYKLFDKPPFELDDKVKVVYLTECLPNRVEFLKAVKKFNVFKIIKEGFHSVKVLKLRRKTMKQVVKDIDKGVVISTRMLFSELLSKYGDDNLFKVSIDHSHHNNNKKYLKNLKKSIKGIDVFMPVSKELEKFYKGYFPNQHIEYIPHFLSYIPNKEECSKINNKEVVTIGRLAPEKGFFDLLEIAKKVCDKDDEYHFNIIGDGDLHDQIKSKIKENNLEQNVTLHGYLKREEVYEILKKSSIYVMTSFEESFGLVLLEAMSCGLPCFSFNTAQGATEIISQGKNGFLIENRSTDEMTSKILESNLDDLRQMGEFGYETAQSHSKDVISQKWFDFIERGKNEKE